MIDYKDFNKIVDLVFSGKGYFHKNIVIKKTALLLYGKYKIDRKMLMSEFEGYFFAEGCHLKWKPELCSLYTYVLSVSRNFILMFTEKLERKNNVEVLFCDCVEDMLHTPPNTFVKKEGKWKQSEVVVSYTDGGDWSNNVPTPEEAYLRSEMRNHIMDYHKKSKFNDVYLMLFLRQIKIDAACKKIKRTRTVIDRNFRKFKKGLYQYLSEFGYSAEDVGEIYNK